VLARRQLRVLNAFPAAAAAAVGRLDVGVDAAAVEKAVAQACGKPSSATLEAPCGICRAPLPLAPPPGEGGGSAAAAAATGPDGDDDGWATIACPSAAACGVAHDRCCVTLLPLGVDEAARGAVVRCPLCHAAALSERYAALTTVARVRIAAAEAAKAAAAAAAAAGKGDKRARLDGGGRGRGGGSGSGSGRGSASASGSASNAGGSSSSEGVDGTVDGDGDGEFAWTWWGGRSQLCPFCNVLML